MNVCIWTTLACGLLGNGLKEITEFQNVSKRLVNKHVLDKKQACTLLCVCTERKSRNKTKYRFNVKFARHYTKFQTASRSVTV